MNVPEAAIKVLQDNPNGMSAKLITEEILKRKLHPLPAKVPEGIVQRAINRHCIGIDKSYSCQDRYFTASKDTSGTLIYKLVPSAVPASTSVIGSFTYPRHQNRDKAWCENPDNGCRKPKCPRFVDKILLPGSRLSAKLFMET